MSTKDIASGFKDPDMFNFEKKLREALHELSLKRGLLEDSRKDVNQAFLVKYDLERRLDKACRELKESHVQLELAVSAGRKWEEERETVPLHRAHLQAALAEKDTLKEQSRSLQLENVELKRKVEELEGQVHCLSTFQNMSISMQSKVEEVTLEVKRQLQYLTQDQKRLERSVAAAMSLGSRLELATRHYGCVHDKMKNQLKNMEAKMVSLATELDELKSNVSSDVPEKTNLQPQGAFFNEWKSSLHEMESRLKTSEECKNKLHKTLESALRASSKLEKESKVAKDENIQLSKAKEKAEQELKELREKLKERMKIYEEKQIQVGCPFPEVSCTAESGKSDTKMDFLEGDLLDSKKTEE